MRLNILEEKFKKHIDKGYISKNSMEDYNRYFSNYVSNFQTTEIGGNLDTQRIYNELIQENQMNKSISEKSLEFRSSASKLQEENRGVDENFNISNAFGVSPDNSYEVSHQLKGRFEPPSFRKIPGQICVFQNQNNSSKNILEEKKTRKILKHSISENPEEFKSSKKKKKFGEDENNRESKTVYRLSDLEGEIFKTTDDTSESEFLSLKKDLFQSKISQDEDEESFSKSGGGVVRLDLSICEKRQSSPQDKNPNFSKKKNFDTVKRDQKETIIDCFAQVEKIEVMEEKKFNPNLATKRKNFTHTRGEKISNKKLDIFEEKEHVIIVKSEHLVEETSLLEKKSPIKNLFKENYESLTSYTKENKTPVSINIQKDVCTEDSNSKFLNKEKNQSNIGMKNTEKKSKKAYISSLTGDFLTPVSPIVKKREAQTQKKKEKEINSGGPLSLKKGKLTERSVSRSRLGSQERKIGINSKSKSPSAYNLESIIPLKEPKFDSFEARDSSLSSSRLKNGLIYNKTESLLNQKKRDDFRPNLCYDDQEYLEQSPNIVKTIESSKSQIYINNTSDMSPLKIFKNQSFINKTFKSSEKKVRSQTNLDDIVGDDFTNENESETKVNFNKTQPVNMGISKVYHRKMTERKEILKKNDVVFNSNSIFKVSFYSLLKELGRSADPKTFKFLKKLSDDYTEKLSYKEFVLKSFTDFGLFNKDMSKNIEKNEDFAVKNFFIKKNREIEFGIFKQRNTSSNNRKIEISWKCQKLKTRCRSRFSIIQSKTRKVILRIESLPMNAKRIKGTIQKMKDLRSRISDKESSDELRPCLFFLNGQGKHLHFFDLVRRKHANVHSPVLRSRGSVIDDYFVEYEHIFVKSGENKLKFFKISEFSNVKSEEFGGDIISVSKIGDGKVMILTKNSEEIDFYDIREEVKYKVLCEIENRNVNSLKEIGDIGDIEIIGFVRLMPHNRLFIFRNDFFVFEMNLRLEMIKMR